MRWALASFVLCLTPSLCVGQYRIARTWTLGGTGSWHFFIADTVRHRLFLSRQDRVMVVDPADGDVDEEIQGINGAQGIAIAQQSGHGFVTAENDGAVVMFDLKSLKVLRSVIAQEDVEAIMHEPLTNRVFALNGTAHSATAIDAATGEALGNIALGGQPENGVAFNGKLYVNLGDSSQVVEVDAKNLVVTRRWPLAPCTQPMAIAVDHSTGRLFTGCRNKQMVVSDIAGGKVVATVPIGAGVSDAAFDAVSKDIFFANADGTLSIIHEDSADSYSVLQTLTTIPYTRSLAIDPTQRRVYVVGAKTTPGSTDPNAPAAARRPQQVPGSFMLMVIER